MSARSVRSAAIERAWQRGYQAGRVDERAAEAAEAVATCRRLLAEAIADGDEQWAQTLRGCLQIVGGER